MDYYAAGWPYLFIGLTECLVVSYAYGFTNFLDDLKEIMNFSPGGFFRADLRVLYGRIAPLIVFVSITSILQHFLAFLFGTFRWPAFTFRSTDRTDTENGFLYKFKVQEN